MLGAQKVDTRINYAQYIVLATIFDLRLSFLLADNAHFWLPLRFEVSKEGHLAAPPTSSTDIWFEIRRAAFLFFPIAIDKPGGRCAPFPLQCDYSLFRHAVRHAIAC